MVELADEAAPSGRRWSQRRIGASLVHACALLLPVAASLAVVYFLSGWVPPPSRSLALYLVWWLGLSATATIALVVVGRFSRRLLPIATLLKLSLVFPDATPSRFRTALMFGTVKTLEQRLTEARDPNISATVAAQRLLTLVAALDEHDGITRGHSERVRAYSQMIGRELGLDRRDLELLNWAALLHDIGKLDVPAKILNKKGKPSDDEWETIRRHPEFGGALIAPLRDWLGEWSSAIDDHHERWDGGGYPNGIAGADISLAGRIVAVADVLDVITSTRSYKQASSMAAARAEIARMSGTQFDPEIVRAFLAVSLGHARLASGPLAWLADASVLARTPVSAAASTLSAAAVIGVAVAPGAAADQGSSRSGALATPAAQTTKGTASSHSTAPLALHAGRKAVGTKIAHIRAASKTTGHGTLAQPVADPVTQPPDPQSPDTQSPATANDPTTTPPTTAPTATVTNPTTTLPSAPVTVTSTTVTVPSLSTPPVTLDAVTVPSVTTPTVTVPLPVLPTVQPSTTPTVTVTVPSLPALPNLLASP